MTSWFKTVGTFKSKLNEFQYTTYVKKPSVYSVISDFNYCEHSQCDANTVVKMVPKRDSTGIMTLALLKDDGGK